MASAAPASGGAGAPPAQPAFAHHDVPLLPTENTGLVVAGVMLASLLQVLDSTIANVALPHMQASLGATPDEVSWVLTSYIVASAVAMPITGWLADRVGSRRLFIVSVAGFVIASMLCGMSQNIGEMVLFRALQGISGAFISPLSQSAMLDINRPSKQAQMMAIWAMGIMVGPILGPILGGYLTENFSWRAVFYVNVPLGVLSLFILIGGLPSRVIARRRFDLFGFAMVALALSSLQLLLDRGNQIDWLQSKETWVYLVLAMGGAWVAVLHLATARNPLFERTLFADRNFVVAQVVMLVVGMVMFATMALLPPMLQRLFGYSVIDTGWALMPRGVGTLLAMQVAGLLVRKGVDPRLLVSVGFGLVIVSFQLMSHWSLDIDRWTVTYTGFLQGVGMGLVFIPLNTAAFATIAPHLRTDGSSLLNLSRSIGASIGISLTTTLLSRNVQISHSDLGAHINSAAIDVIDVSTIDRFQALGSTVLSYVDAMVTRQAAMIAYIDNFYIMMWATIFATPLALLLRRTVLRPGEKPPPPDAH